MVHKQNSALDFSAVSQNQICNGLLINKFKLCKFTSWIYQELDSRKLTTKLMALKYTALKLGTDR